MARFLKKREKSKGQSPGALIFIGTQKMDDPKMRMIDYEPDSVRDIEIVSVKDAVPFRTASTVSWLNINGLHDAALIGEIGSIFGLHPLVLEDILNTGQRPKLEEFDDYLFLVMKMLRFDSESGNIFTEQLSIILGENFVLTFQERPGDVFEPVRERIKKKSSRIRGARADYLMHALMDTVVDNYISLIEMMGERIEDLEEEILAGADASAMEKINLYKRELNYFRKSVRPAKEAIFKIPRLDTHLITEFSLPFFKDIEDLISLASESIEIYRDLLTDQLDIYNSIMANKMNDIMKTLTLFAALFIPLTFIAGIYGTNFEYLPELHYRYSYFIFWGVMIVIGTGLLIYFKRKRWF